MVSFTDCWSTETRTKIKSKRAPGMPERSIRNFEKGQIDRLMREGCFIQAKLPKTASHKPQDQAKIFTNLIMEGQIKLAMRFLDKDSNHRVLSLTEEIMNQLRQKHPEVQETMLRALLFGPTEVISDIRTQVFAKLMEKW